jgi:HTH-type transcriptional regulator/antitoxin HigA
VDDQTIIREEDYAQALTALERLWGAAPGTQEGDELEAMTAIVNAYEDEHAEFD